MQAMHGQAERGKMLGFVCAPDRGQGDRLLAEVAKALIQAGCVLGGVVQVNTQFAPDRACLMDLRLLTDGSVIRISQSLGAGSSGCRLDASGLEEAVGRVGAGLQQTKPDLLILNKFGKQEAEGRGFRPVIAQALSAGVPVLTAVSARNRPQFEAFCDGIATELPADAAVILGWCLAQTRAGTAV